jgi:hypothetical protein
LVGSIYVNFIAFSQAISEENLFLIDQSKTMIACGGHVCYRIRTKCETFIENWKNGQSFEDAMWDRCYNRNPRGLPLHI